MTFEEMHAVVASIRQGCDGDQLRFWSFIHYVSTRYPEILGVNMSAEQKDRCEAVLTRANPSAVFVVELERARLLRELEARQDNAEPGTAEGRPAE
jgi:hypothetical protein